MNALVIYDTTFGNTQQIAQVIAHVLGEQGFVRCSRGDGGHLKSAGRSQVGLTTVL